MKTLDDHKPTELFAALIRNCGPDGIREMLPPENEPQPCEINAELLAALIDVMDWYEQSGERECGMTRRARAAIEKATGATPALRCEFCSPADGVRCAVCRLESTEPAPGEPCGLCADNVPVCAFCGHVSEVAR